MAPAVWEHGLPAALNEAIISHLLWLGNVREARATSEFGLLWLQDRRLCRRIKHLWDRAGYSYGLGPI